VAQTAGYRCRVTPRLTLGRRFSRPAFCERGEFLGDPIGIDDIGVEVIMDPIAEIGMAFVFGIVDCCEELGHSPKDRRRLPAGIVRSPRSCS
jgi:hypothetical protein